MKQISSFMHEITDEFKIVVVDAIRALCLKFPQKYPVLMNFLSSALRDEVRACLPPFFLSFPISSFIIIFCYYY